MDQQTMITKTMELRGVGRGQADDLVDALIKLHGARLDVETLSEGQWVQAARVARNLAALDGAAPPALGTPISELRGRSSR